MIAAWLCGYYNAKRDNLTVDLQDVEAAADKIQFYCETQSNWDVPVMQAIERLRTGK
jgi:hypothetical protein